MKIIYNKIFLEHNTGNHPENKGRLIYFTQLSNSKINYDESILKLVHTKEYVTSVKKHCLRESSLTLDTPVCKKSFQVAVYAANAAIKAAEEKAFALVRPPGHHAGKNFGGGFCLFNNIAIAVQDLLNNGKKVFILDFDLHHGNGTQEIFLDKKNVIYFSLHQSPPCYPGTGLVSENNCINIPLPYGTSDADYINSLEKKLIPILYSFNPDIVAVSAGFDSYYKDKDSLGFGIGFNLTTKSYKKIREILKPHPSFFVLEGGYKPESIKEEVDVFVK